jgi:uridine kinase
VLRASLDDFKRPWRERHLYDRESGEGYYRNAFDLEAGAPAAAVARRPRRLRDLRALQHRPLTQVDHSASVTVAGPDAVLVVDGVFAFRPEVDASWDLRIWLEIDEELSVRRGVHRDGAGSEALHRDRYLVAERLYLAEVDPARRADVVIDNTDLASPRILVER